MLWSYAFFRYELCSVAIVTFLFSIVITIYLRFLQIDQLKHSWFLLKTRVNAHLEQGEISQAQALTLGLSGTIGIANISVVAACIIIAGPGSIFWLILSAFFGMSLKFCEATLGQKHRLCNENELYIGGPMVVLDKLLDEDKKSSSHLKTLFLKCITVLYTLSLLGIILFFGNLFQVNQLLDVLQENTLLTINFIQYLPYVLIFLIISLVWNGKFNRLAYFIARIIPIAILTYLSFCFAIILLNLDQLIDIFIIILKDAFTLRNQGYDNLFVFVIGVLLGMISHESGLGISAIAHSSARSAYPVRQGFIAMLEPFIDTILICFLTAIVFLMAIEQGFLPIGYSSLNIKLAFEFFIPWFGVIFDIIMLLLTLSCLISCYFYSGKLMQYLFNARISIYTMIVYCGLIYLGTNVELIEFLPAMVWLIPFVIVPNLIIIGLNIKDIKKDLVVYFTNLDDSVTNHFL